MSPTEIARVRRFARAVTAEVGALDSSFLGRGRPLGAARVLNAIGAGRAEIGEIRSYLGLDSGLMSRLLRSLEEEGLVATVPHPADARRRVASLTEAGRREFDAYEALSNARAVALLQRAPCADDLLRAMDHVALVLGRDAIAITEAEPTGEAARACLATYYAELAARFAGGFDVARSCDPEASAMVRPRGVFLLAVSDGLPVGCVGLKGNGGPEAEIKRLWIDPASRGLGLAKRLMREAEDVARDLGIRTLRLDTHSALPEALALYRRLGWVEIDRFNDDPYPDHFFEKAL
ncbi:bifunctional helix-turn-helix transcriptional regulator/GNAT family N-acetyltransferase [Methylobacterium sp. P5_C11]